MMPRGDEHHYPSILNNSPRFKGREINYSSKVKSDVSLRRKLFKIYAIIFSLKTEYLEIHVRVEKSARQGKFLFLVERGPDERRSESDDGKFLEGENYLISETIFNGKVCRDFRFVPGNSCVASSHYLRLDPPSREITCEVMLHNFQFLIK